MKRKPVIRVAILIGICFSLIMSCKYDEVLPPEPDPGLQVKFSADIIPIFNANCNLAGCHDGAGHVPDLKPTAAFDALWDGNYINTVTPDQSELYLWMTGARGLPMPVQGSISTYNASVLQWIKQGALNN